MPDIIQRESRLRSFLKGLTWRIIATGTLVAAAWWYTGDTTLAFSFGAVEFVAKLVLYYLHERAWQMLPRGTVRKVVAPNTTSDSLSTNNKIEKN